MTVHGFWGLKVLPDKQYCQKVTLPFMITMASLSDTIASDERCSLLISVDGAEFVLCSLTPGKLEQQVLSTTIMEGEEVTFSIKGNNAIHLTGNHVFDTPNDENENPGKKIHDQEMNASQCSLDSADDTILSHTSNQQKRKRLADTYPHDQAKRVKGDNDTASLDQHHGPQCEKEQKKLQSYMDSLNGHVLQLKEQLSLLTETHQQKSHKDTLKSSATAKGDTKTTQQNKTVGDDDQKNKKQAALEKKKNKVDKKKSDDGNTKVDGKQRLDGNTKVDGKKRLDGKNETSSIKKSTSTSTSKATNQESAVEKKSPKLKVVRLSNGLVVEDTKIGSGRPAGTGSKVGMRYIGKLLNGKKFDSNTSGPLFRFVLGKGAAIRGLDIGIAGMKVGGERKLVIPPTLAYRQRGMPPDIPPNSTLVFNIKLMELQ